ncbi:acylphosphatase [Agrilactobacillus yilanensis]|uniref:acylphosphatase n=1 Tax=Agrilactobacillus yilanensis TaxID=2485997 RepID=A0ABW4J8T2_9LACO|nr:acylphosphatase [Agrilactobacillus yilanensis]
MIEIGVALTVYGRVQGVGFRYSAKILADNLGIKGTVQNNLDGSVYIEAVGRPKPLTAFIDNIKASPTPYGKVTHVDEKKLGLLPDFSDFKVIG